MRCHFVPVAYLFPNSAGRTTSHAAVVSASQWAGLSMAMLHGSKGQGGEGDLASLEESISTLDEAGQARCQAERDCYPELDKDDKDVCWGPTSNGESGFSPASPEEFAELKPCLARVHQRVPRALHDYFECSADQQRAYADCLAKPACPADVTACDDMGNELERACKDAAAAELAPVWQEE